VAVDFVKTTIPFGAVSLCKHSSWKGTPQSVVYVSLSVHWFDSLSFRVSGNCHSVRLRLCQSRNSVHISGTVKERFIDLLLGWFSSFWSYLWSNQVVRTSWMANRYGFIYIFIYSFIHSFSRSQWPRSLRRASAADCLWVRIPPGVWMFVFCDCCMLLGRGLCVGLVSRPVESYRVWCVWVWLRGPVKGGCDPESGRSVTEKNIYLFIYSRFI
jgi:hypothetical protein